MSQAITKSINLQEKLNAARQENQERMKQGINISDPSLVWLSGKEQSGLFVRDLE